MTTAISLSCSAARQVTAGYMLSHAGMMVSSEHPIININTQYLETMQPCKSTFAQSHAGPSVSVPELVFTSHEAWQTKL